LCLTDMGYTGPLVQGVVDGEPSPFGTFLLLTFKYLWVFSSAKG
jgi:hypothetical protein